MPTQDILNSNEATRQLLATVNEDECHAKPDDQTWSALECLEHIVVVEKGLLNVLRMELSDESPETVGVAQIQSALANRDVRIPAPDFILPKGRFATWQAATDQFFAQRQTLLEMTENKVHEQTGTFPHPLLGPLSKLEWIYFGLAHTERHLSQIKDVLALNRAG